MDVLVVVVVRVRLQTMGTVDRRRREEKCCWSGERVQAVQAMVPGFVVFAC